MQNSLEALNIRLPKYYATIRWRGLWQHPRIHVAKASWYNFTDKGLVVTSIRLQVGRMDSHMALAMNTGGVTVDTNTN